MPTDANHLLNMQSTEEVQNQPNVLSCVKGSFPSMGSFAVDNWYEIKNKANKAHGTDQTIRIFSQILPHSPTLTGMIEYHYCFFI